MFGSYDDIRARRTKPRTAFAVGAESMETRETNAMRRPWEVYGRVHIGVFFETDIFRSRLNAFGAFMRFRDVQFSLSRGIIPIHPEISLKIHSYRHCSKGTAALFSRTYTTLRSTTCILTTGYVRKKALAVCVKISSNKRRVCQEFFRLFY